MTSGCARVSQGLLRSGLRLVTFAVSIVTIVIFLLGVNLTLLPDIVIGQTHRSAILEGTGAVARTPTPCDVTMSTPNHALWMLRIERAVILDCSVVITIFDSSINPFFRKPVLTHSCASADPGILYINSSTLTIRMQHKNATDYTFTIVVTARQAANRNEHTCRGFKCDTGTCVSQSLTCDGIDNCFDYSDEAANGTSQCDGGFWSFQGENWGVLASVLGAGLVLGVTAACCRHLRRRRRSSLDDLYDLNEGPYVHKYAYRYAVIRPPKRPNKTNVVLGRDGHMHYNATNV